MKKFLMVLILIAIAAGPLSVRAEIEKSASASVDIMSDYIWRGQKLSNGLALQPSVGITYGGFGVNLWGNYDTSFDEHTETDITLNYTFTREKFSFDVGYIYYALDELDDTQELYITVGYDIFLSPSLTVYYDFDEGDGAFIVVSIGHSFEVPKTGSLRENMSLDLGASVSYNASSEYSMGDFDDFYNGDFSASLNIPITENLSVGPMVAYSFSLSTDAENAIEGLATSDGDSNFMYGGINATLSF